MLPKQIGNVNGKLLRKLEATGRIVYRSSRSWKISGNFEGIFSQCELPLQKGTMMSAGNTRINWSFPFRELSVLSKQACKQIKNKLCGYKEQWLTTQSSGNLGQTS